MARYSKDYYAILGLSQTAHADDIKSAFKRLARKRHPDKDLENAQATANFQELHDAYSTLSDVAKRREYDVVYPSLKQENAQQRQASDSSRNTAGRSQPSTNPAYSARNPCPTQIPKQRLAQLENQLRELFQRSCRLENAISVIANKLRDMQSLFKVLQTKVSQNADNEAMRRGRPGMFPLSPGEQARQDQRAKAQWTSMHILAGRIRIYEANLTSLRLNLELAKIEILSKNREKASTDYRYNMARFEEMAEERARAEDTRRREEQVRAAKRERMREEQARAAERERMREEQARAARDLKEAHAHARQRQQDKASPNQPRCSPQAAKRKRKRAATDQTIDSEATPQWRKRKAVTRDESTDSGDPKDSCICLRMQGIRQCQQCRLTTSRYTSRCPNCLFMQCADCGKA